MKNYIKYYVVFVGLFLMTSSCLGADRLKSEDGKFEVLWEKYREIDEQLRVQYTGGTVVTLVQGEDLMLTLIIRDGTLKKVVMHPNVINVKRLISVFKDDKNKEGRYIIEIYPKGPGKGVLVPSVAISIDKVKQGWVCKFMKY